MPELVACPKCERKLKVPETLIGEPVRCPQCGTAFKAERPGGPASAPVEEEEDYRFETSEPPRRSSRSPRRDDPDDDERDDGFEERRPPRRSRKRRRDTPRYEFRGEPDRGVMILILGILSIVCSGCFLLGIPLGIAAFVMGDGDLSKMGSGTMDDRGEGLTKAGRICGIVGVGLSLAFCCLSCVLTVVGNQ